MSRKAQEIFALAPLMVLLCALSPADAGGEELAGERRALLDRFVGQFTNFGMFDGAVVVDVGGEVVYRRSFGYAHAEFGISHDESTRFRIASLSKVYTDVAFARLADEGRIAADDRLARFLPEFPRAADITIEQLLTHTAGIPHSNRQPWGDASEAMALDEIVSRLAELPLDFEPGTGRSYSNGGYAVAAKVLEDITKKDFAAAMREVLFNPLGLDDTGHLEDSRAVMPNMATGYRPGVAPGTRGYPRFYAVEARPGGGSLYATASDVLRFARAVFRDGFVSDEAYALFVGVPGEEYLAQGRSPGFVAKLLYRPDSDVIVISLANNYAVPAGWATAIADIATGAVVDDPWPVLEAGEPTVAEDSPLLGRYRSSFGNFEFDLERSTNGYLVLDDEDGTVAMIPLADGSYLQPQYFQRCEQEAATRVITCRMLSGDERYTGVLTPVPD